MNTNDASDASEIIETPAFMEQVEESMPVRAWDDLRLPVDRIVRSMSVYGAVRPRNDGLRYLSLMGRYKVGYEMRGGQVIYAKFI